ncbi:MAG: hypothetical protein ACOCUI_00940 [bacterium]
MRKRKLYYNKGRDRLIYKIPLEPVLVDKVVFEVFIKRFGEKKTLDFIKTHGRGISYMHPFYDIINNELTEKQINKVIDKFIYDSGKDLSIDYNVENDVCDYINELKS